jgi:hypothetical protein
MWLSMGKNIVKDVKFSDHGANKKGAIERVMQTVEH